MEKLQSSAASFINLDLEITSSNDLAPLISYFGKKVFVLFNGESENGNFLCLEPLFEDLHSNNIENCINHFVHLLKNLPIELAEVWNSCHSRVFDFGFEGGIEQPPLYTAISNALLREIAQLNVEIRITIYPFSESSENS